MLFTVLFKVYRRAGHHILQSRLLLLKVKKYWTRAKSWDICFYQSSSFLYSKTFRILLTSPQISKQIQQQPLALSCKFVTMTTNNMFSIKGHQKISSPCPVSGYTCTRPFESWDNAFNICVLHIYHFMFLLTYHFHVQSCLTKR